MLSALALPMSSAKSSGLPASHYRFVVRSAEEAVKLIRQKLGDKAQVVSVNQVSRKGLARFLKAPKLEVIATVSSVEENPLPSKPLQALEESRLDALEASSGDLIPPSKGPTRRESLIYKHYQSPDDDSFSPFLKKAGFSERMIYHFRIKSKRENSSFSSKPSQPLKDMVHFLIQEYQSLKKVPLGKRVAFLGSAGVGKSTLLCKQLAREVFIEQSCPSVLKLDHALPHSNEALSVFCKALGVPCFKTSSLTKMEVISPLYMDLSGPSLKDKVTWELLNQQINKLDLESKVWVVQAAYDEELILENIHLAKELGATHLAFTHLDEAYRFNKLWDSLLFSGLSPALCSYGPGISGEATFDILQFLLAKAFPDTVLKEVSSCGVAGSGLGFIQN